MNYWATQGSDIPLQLSLVFYFNGGHMDAAVLNQTFVFENMVFIMFVIKGIPFYHSNSFLLLLYTNYKCVAPEEKKK